MKNKILNKTQILLWGFALLFGALLCTENVWADGSKDLYPSGTTGLRAKLYTGPATGSISRPAYPFPNNGVHYVYAKAGETIMLASSAQGSGSARINLYKPDGTVAIANSTVGNISNRTAELAGPLLPGEAANANKYAPVYYQVPVGADGVYRVEFISRTTTGDPSSGSISADGAWTQASNAEIMAWDVSVANTAKNAFIPGRVYTNVLNLSNGYTPSSSLTDGFYGLIYVLTKDGYTYRVNNNGNNGLLFTFFVNNNGFIDTNGAPVYKSLPSSSATALAGKVQNPNLQDTETQITHKLFYTLPASDLPLSASVAYPSASNETTWLKNTVVEPDVTDVALIGAEGVEGQVSNKGGYITFNAGAQGQYFIEIESTATPEDFPKRTMTGASKAGINKVYWDGKDGAGNLLPSGNVPAKLTVSLQGAEVHFPFIDMEYNTKGIIIELTNGPNGPSDPDRYKVYWNDTDIPNASNGTNAPKGRYSDPKNNSHLPTALGGANSLGTLSNSNGHIWGQGATGTSGQFGDEKAMDTWTFIKGEAVTLETTISVKIADLEVVSVTPDKNTIYKDDEVSYTVKVKNNGPDDAVGSTFTFKVPDGFDPVNIVFTANGCGTESVALVYNATTHTYTSKLDLPNGCEITYKITVKATNPQLGAVEVEAAILRPNDVTDPDATNSDPTVPPTNAQYECTNNGLGGACNNIKSSTGVAYSNAGFTLIKDGVFNDVNSDGFAQAGETITYTLTLTNTGEVDLSDIVVSDPLLGGNVTVTPAGDTNTNAILNIGEVWVYTLTYTLTQSDINNKGVYNQAKVNGKDTVTNGDMEETSVPDPSKPVDPAHDPGKPEHTFVPLKTNSLLITNPMVRQRLK